MQASNGFTILDKLLSLLPRSPFRAYIEAFENLPYLGYLNWFFPVAECLVVIETWLTAVALYLVYSVIMRWVKVIGS